MSKHFNIFTKKHNINSVHIGQKQFIIERLNPLLDRNKFNYLLHPRNRKVLETRSSDFS